MEVRTEILPGDPPCVVRHRHAVVNGVRLHYVEADPTPHAAPGETELCVALHGFPEFWYSWRRQIPALAAAGFRVVVPDLRGYNESDKPPGVGSYRLEALVDDVTQLIRHAGTRRAHVLGHDWGGALAWAVAMRRPESVAKLAVLNAPHPAAFLRELRTPAQRLRSWYMLFFQLPVLPEVVLCAGNYSFLERALRRQPVRPDAFTAADVRRYRQALAQPGALTAALYYYRAMFRRRGALGRDLRPITAPTLLIWGERDRFLVPRLTEGLEAWVPNLRVVRLPNASHWVQNDAPEEVNRALVAFLRGRESSGPLA